MLNISDSINVTLYAYSDIRRLNRLFQLVADYDQTKVELRKNANLVKKVYDKYGKRCSDDQLEMKLYNYR